MRSLPAAGDSTALLREVAFALLLRRHAPIEAGELARVTGLPDDTVRAVVGTLGDAGWLDRDDAGRITGAAGLSLATGPHDLRIGDAEFHTWCAFDSLGISAALGADASLRTHCGDCGAPIDLAIVAGVPQRSDPERLWLSNGGGDLRASFCAPTVLLCGAEHGARWAEAHGGNGELIDLAEGARRGALSWAGCASVAARLST